MARTGQQHTTPTSSHRSRRKGCTCLVVALLYLCFVRITGPVYNIIQFQSSDVYINGNGNDDYDRGVRVYAPSNSTSNVAVCLIIKNETLYLDEWLDYHIALGFSPIYIYDNSLNFELNTALFSGIHTWYETREDIWDHIRLIEFPMLAVQIPAYYRCINEDAKHSTFAALIDTDEFLVLKKHDNVVDFMDQHCNHECGELSINWEVMGTSNEKQYTPVPVTKRNVHTNGMYGTIKVIVRPSYVSKEPSGYWDHSVMLQKGNWVDTNGKRHSYHRKSPNRRENYDKPDDVAVLYHYIFKSEDEFHYKKCVRGNSLGSKSMCNYAGYYKLFNGTMFDNTTWKQLTRMVPKYKVYGQAINTSTF
ncbi:hypothetical protein ACHAXR_003681 [Thalassiosira sp. AJA248-18]